MLKNRSLTIGLILVAACIVFALINAWVAMNHYGSISLTNLFYANTQLPELWVFNTILISALIFAYVYLIYSRTKRFGYRSSSLKIIPLTGCWGFLIYIVATASIIKMDHPQVTFDLFIQYNLDQPVIQGLMAFIPYSMLAGALFNRMLRTELKNQFISRSLSDHNEQLQKQIEERRESEKQLMEAKKEAQAGVKAKDQFLSNMSHDIRTPMNGIIGLVNLLSESSLDEKQRKYLSAIQDSSKTLLSLIDQILDLSKINSEKLTLEYVDFNLWDTIKTAENTFYGLAREKSIVLRSVIHPGVPKIASGDPVRINQILVNLLGNAIKFTNDGGVDLIVNAKDTDDGPRLQIEINDTGIGIPKDKLEKIFESFEQASVETTRQYGGSGLGLAISKELVELYGGKIHVESEVGKGTSFSFDLQLKPATGALLEKKQKEEEGFQMNPEEMNILVAEDNKVNQMVVNTILEKSGFNVDIAENGQEVINMIYQKEYDVILMDVRMPIMGGLDATRFIRNATEPPLCNIPIIALSASTMPEEVEIYHEIGMNDHLPKPFTQKQLMACLNKHLGTTRLSQSA